MSKEIILAQDKCGTMKSSQKPFSESDKEEIRNKITNTFISDYIIQQSDQKEKEIEATLAANKTKTGYVINETPKTEGDKLFEAIVSKYKGKIVFVDFWATWCGPCRSGMENIKPLKAELEGKDIEFVYITNHTSPLETWNMMVPDIKGQHFRIEPDEWNKLASRFNISGIPHYMLVDKSGNIVKDKIYFASSNSELRKMFEEYLNP
jgi:thiol-disulfide isomerase/thioredoxin